MARINTNVGSLVAQTQLGRAQGSLSQALQRLSSGLRINSGADDPAGLIASESLRSEIQGVTTAIDNSQRATNIISTAEGALSEVSNLLVSMKALAVQAANTGAMSPDEIKANQLQIDSAVQSITRISNVTNFAGLNLLNGSMDYTMSGVVNSQLGSVHVYNAQFEHPGQPPGRPVGQAGRAGLGHVKRGSSQRLHLCPGRQGCGIVHLRPHDQGRHRHECHQRLQGCHRRLGRLGRQRRQFGRRPGLLFHRLGLRFAGLRPDLE
jgi:hypothetical protein